MNFVLVLRKTTTNKVNITKVKTKTNLFDEDLFWFVMNKNKDNKHVIAGKNRNRNKSGLFRGGGKSVGVKSDANGSIEGT